MGNSITSYIRSYISNYTLYSKSKLVNTNISLKHENTILSSEILDLKEEIKQLKLNSGNKESMENFEKKLQESVKKLVDDMLENDSINSTMIPDYIERKIYTNVFTILIGIMKEIIDDTSINILNQNIKLQMV